MTDEFDPDDSIDLDRENLKFPFLMEGGGWVKVRHQHRTTDVPDMVWVSNEFFELSEADQLAEIEEIKAHIYSPIDSGGGYMAAWHLLFKRADLEVIPKEDPEELLSRAIRKFGAFSLEWYCAMVIGTIEKHTGWEGGECRYPEPIPDPEDKFSAGFQAGYLLAEGALKHDLEIDAMRGVKFGEKNTALATKARSRRRDANEQWIIDVSQKALDLGFGRFKSGKINQSDLGRRCLKMNSPVKDTRVRQIIRAAVRNGELA